MTESGMMKTEFLMGIWIMQMNPSLLSTKTERSGTGTEILQNRQQKKIPITLQKILPVQKISVIPLICTAGMREPVSISPFQQAETDASPVGRGNGWYYYDEESSEFLPW